MKTKLYPIKFNPIFKEKIWGGEKLASILAKNSPEGNIGESWEISDVKGDKSIISNGSFQGKTISWLLENFKEELVGLSVYREFGNEFPLLIKFIDAKENLSVQLHPDDKLAKKRHDSFGKTEMWYIVQADEGSEIIVGFKEGVSEKDYDKALEREEIEKLLNFETVKPGDAFFIKPGLIHAIGKGVLLAEIQQTSDITYRVYDYNRSDKDGNQRQLHTEEAKKAIDFEGNQDFKIGYNPEENKLIDLVENQYFTTKKLQLTENKTIDYSEQDSFVIYMNIEGSVKISVNGFSEELKKGESILIPAIFNKVELHTKNATLLEVTI